MKFFPIILFITLASIAVCGRADESLASCSKQKHKQLELAAKNRQSAPTRSRSKKRSNHTPATTTRQKIDQIDDWLWKNCRSHAAEMRTIEQQYM
ncbi:MAG: hypothetical protein ABW049_06720 [Spongiibacteraceae bacterium]